MAELELTRVPDDRRLYAIEGVGTLRLEGWASRTAAIEAGGTRLRAARRRTWTRTIEATDAGGAIAGAFEPNGLRRGGRITWGGHELVLRAASAWRERYALADGDRELAIFDGKGWGSRPVEIAVDDAAAVDPALLLFAAFVVRGLAEDATAAAGAGASVAVSGG